MEVKDIVQGTNEWLEWRRTGITATEASVIADTSPFKSPLELYHDKIRSEPVAPVSSVAMEWGSRLESAIVQKFCDEHGCEATCSKLYRHDRIPWALASLDAETDLNGEHVIIECKTSNDSSKWADDSVPEYYRDQVQWQMFVTGIKTTYFSVLVNGREWFERKVVADPKRQEELFNACMVFKQHVDNKVPPEASDKHAASDTKLLLESRCDVSEETLEVDDDVYNRYRSAKAALEQAESEMELVKLDLAKRLGNMAALTYGGKKFVTVVNRKPTASIDSKLLQAKHPQAYFDCIKMSKGSSYMKII